MASGHDVVEHGVPTLSILFNLYVYIYIFIMYKTGKVGTPCSTTSWPEAIYKYIHVSMWHYS